MVKGGAAVDTASGLEETHHVLKEGDLLWSIVLAKADVQTGRNSNYKLQVCYKPEEYQHWLPV